MTRFAIRKRALRRAWHVFRADRAGKRFEHFHQRRQKQRKGVYGTERIVNVGGGILLCAMGLALVPAPGPGWLIVAVGLALLTSESLKLARFLDWTEVSLRRLFRRVS